MIPVRGSSGPAPAIAARRTGTSSGCVSARHRRPITSSWRRPSVALKLGLAYSISPWASNIHTRSGESSTSVAMRARRAGLGLGLGDLRVGADDRAVGPRGGAHRDPDVAAVGVRDAELLVDARPWCARRARREAARRGIEPPPGASSALGSDGAPISSSTGAPIIRAIASLAFRTTPCGSQIMMPSSRASGSASGGAASAVRFTVRRPSDTRRRARCRRSPASAGRRRACGAGWRCGRRRGGRRRTSSRPRRARAAGRG